MTVTTQADAIAAYKADEARLRAAAKKADAEGRADEGLYYWHCVVIARKAWMGERDNAPPPGIGKLK